MSREEGKGHHGPAPVPRERVSLFRPGQPLTQFPVMLDQRTGLEMRPNSQIFAPVNPTKVWESLGEIHQDPEVLLRNGLLTDAEQHPAAAGFDLLRTSVLQAMAKNLWTRLIVAAPTAACGASFTAANLALSLARLPSCRTVLLDLDLKRPELADRLGMADPPPLVEFLTGDQPLESHFRRMGRNLALGLNGQTVARASETLQEPEFVSAMLTISENLQPDLIVMDAPPILASDAVMALSPQADAVLLVVDGTQTPPSEIQEAERLLEDRLPLLGVVLNRGQDRGSARRFARRLTES